MVNIPAVIYAVTCLTVHGSPPRVPSLGVIPMISASSCASTHLPTRSYINARTRPRIESGLMPVFVRVCAYVSAKWYSDGISENLFLERHGTIALLLQLRQVCVHSELPASEYLAHVLPM